VSFVCAVRQKYPFDILAEVVLLDRLHALVKLPEGDGSSRGFRMVQGLGGGSGRDVKMLGFAFACPT
jgi:hypothetical protein